VLEVDIGSREATPREPRSRIMLCNNIYSWSGNAPLKSLSSNLTSFQGSRIDITDPRSDQRLQIQDYGTLGTFRLVVTRRHKQNYSRMAPKLTLYIDTVSPFAYEAFYILRVRVSAECGGIFGVG
jgi:hypothetical protein